MELSRDNIINSEETLLDKDSSSLRPELLEDFIGQQNIKENLKVFINAAKKKEQSLDHVLLHGPPGLGKTTLAHIISKELNVNVHTTTGPLLTKAGDLAAILTNLNKNDVLFIDEIHRLNSSVEEILYPAMEDFKLDLIVGTGPAARTINIDIAPFTLVGATTRIGMISNPLRDRFGIPLRMEFYSVSEQKELLKRAAKIIKINITEDSLLEISHRSRNTPRIALRLLRRIHDFSLVANLDLVTQDFTVNSLNRLNIDPIGLDSLDYEYLNFIYDNYQELSVGINTIASALSEQKDNIEEHIEPYLIKIGFINKTPRGRSLSQKAILHIKQNT